MRVAGILVIASAACRAPAEVQIVDAQSLEDGGVIVLRAKRWPEDDGSISRLDRDGATVWSERIVGWIDANGTATTTLGSLTSIAGDRVMTVAVDPSAVEDVLQARSLDNGRLLWEVPLGPHDRERPGLARAPLATGNEILACLQSGEVICVDAARGTWARTRTSKCTGMASLGTRTIVDDGYRVSVIDRCVTTDLDLKRGCVIDGNYVSTVYEGSGTFAFVVLAGGDPARRSKHALDLGGAWPNGGCFGYRGDAIFSVHRGDEHALVRVAMDGHVVGRIDVGDPNLQRPRYQVHAELEGSNTRFVPSVDDRSRTLLVVDLETMSIASRLELGANRTWTTHLGDSWYVAVSGRPLALLRIDGATGRLAAAAWVDGDVGEYDLRVGGGGVWLYSRDFTERLAIARLDATTLRPTFVGSAIVVSDASGDERLRRLR